MVKVDFSTIYLDNQKLRYVSKNNVPYFFYADMCNFIGNKYRSTNYIKKRLGTDGYTNVNTTAGVYTVVSPEWLFKFFNHLKHYDESRVRILMKYYKDCFNIVGHIKDHTVYCRVCGKPVSPERVRNRAVYCSLKCKLESNRKYQRIYQHELWLSKKSTVTKTCPVCGNEFIARLSTQIYCSTQCSNKVRGDRIKELRKLRKSKFYDPKIMYSNADMDTVDWDCEHIDAYLRRLKAWEWGLVKDDLKTWITN